jgi:preprotein translocase subunit SecA
MMSFMTNLFGDPQERLIKRLDAKVELINALEEKYAEIPLEEFPRLTAEFRDRLQKGEKLDDLLPDVFALTREAAKRTLGQRHFDVQLIGGMILHQGAIAEMKTGEGKTLAATLPVSLHALRGKGVHVVTVNDYLARRDTVWMGQIYHALGLTVGCINHETSFLYGQNFQASKISNDQFLISKKNQNDNEKDQERDTIGGFKVVDEFLRPCTRQEAYAADITYGTNNEYGFDYLRDNLVQNPQEVRQREHYFAIVDEVDSILIDEARTPLIISAPDEESGDLYRLFSRLIPQLQENKHYNIDEKLKAATLTEEGIERVEQLLGVHDIYTEKGMRYVHHLEQALRASTLFKRDRDYVIKSAPNGGGEVIIVDEFTGRLMPGRRWSDGLHQAVEAKEGVAVQRESRTLASVTFQNYFRLYEKLSGMTGTAQTSAEEFHTVYHIDAVSIPTHKPLIRQDMPDRIYQSEKGKFQAVAREINNRHQKGQPVLVGTVSIEKNELLSLMLKREGVPHQVLNAKNHEREAEIIAQAGKPGAVTIATNMAGRGVDIILGGYPSSELSAEGEYKKWEEEQEKVKELGGLFVLGTERHEARRIDNQLRGRSGRQGDPGESQFFISLEDDLMRIFAPDRIKSLMGTFGIPEDEPIEHRMISRAIEQAQAKVEGFHFDARKHLLEYDDVVNKQREAVYRERRELLHAALEKIPERVEATLQNALRPLIAFHTAGDSLDSWNSKEIEESLAALSVSFPAQERIKTLSKEMSSVTDIRNKISEETETHLLEIIKEKEREMESEPFAQAARRLWLQIIDMLWMDHLEMLDNLRNSVRLRAYGQRDPLVEYKNEALKLFKEFNQHKDQLFVTNLLRSIAQQKIDAPGASMRLEAESKSLPAAGQAALKITPGKIGRNDPCPCGSGKKYKKCHLIRD